jgi:cobalt-zinc-cadmium efflux system membrane fusion protein
MRKHILPLIAVFALTVPPIGVAQERHVVGDDHKHEEVAHEEADENGATDGHDEHDDEMAVELSPNAMAMAGITVERVVHGWIGESIVLAGEVGFDEDRLVHIAPRFAGIAVQAKYRVGDRVQAGDVVAVVESNESLNHYSIEAPISGWVIARHVTPGEFVSGEHSIYVIADLSTVWVNLAVYPKDAERVVPGLDVLINAVGSDMQVRGTIQYVTPVLDLTTRSITARVVLPNPETRWRPGTFVQAIVTTDTGAEDLVVRESAVQILNEKHVVFVVEGPGRFVPVEVLTGERDDRYIRVLAGLDEGTEYVATGAFELKAEIVTSSLGGHAGHGH